MSDASEVPVRRPRRCTRCVKMTRPRSRRSRNFYAIRRVLGPPARDTVCQLSHLNINNLRSMAGSLERGRACRRAGAALRFVAALTLVSLGCLRAAATSRRSDRPAAAGRGSSRRSTSCRSARSSAIAKGASSATLLQKDFMVIEARRAAADPRLPRRGRRSGEARAALRHQRQHAASGPRPSTPGRPRGICSARCARRTKRRSSRSTRKLRARARTSRPTSRRSRRRSITSSRPYGQTSLYDAVAETARGRRRGGSRRGAAAAAQRRRRR